VRRLKTGATVVVMSTGGPVRRAEISSNQAPVALQLWVMGGTAAEHTREHGCAHLLEHMLFKPIVGGGGGGRPRSALEPRTEAGADLGVDLATALETLGADVNAFTSHDETVVHATVPVCFVAQAIPTLLAPVVEPAFEPAALAEEIKVVVEEIKQYDDDPGSRVVQEMLESLYGDHGYGRPVLGRAHEVRSHDVARLRRFHRELYAGDRVVLVVVGPVQPKVVLDAALPWLSRLPGRGRKLVARRPRPLTRPKVKVRGEDVREAHVALGWLGPPLPAADACALEIASIVLGYGDASRLFTQTRRRARLVTDVHASFYASREGSTVAISANLPPARVGAAVADMLAQVELLRRVPMGLEELQRARAVLRSDVVYRRETVQGQAHALGYYLSLAGDLQAEDVYLAALGALTAEDVRQACARHLDPQQASIGVIVPKEAKGSGDLAETRRKLRALLQGKGEGPRRGKTRHGRDRHGIESLDLPGGLRIRAVVDRSVPMAAGWLHWPGGMRIERKRDQGASTLVAELLTRGCDAIDGDALARQVEGAAAVLEGFSGRSSLGLHFECLATDVSMVLQRALESASAPKFAEEDLAEESRVAIEELEAEADDPATLAFRNAMEALYRNHPFGRRRGGTAETLAGLTTTRLHALWMRHYPLSRAVLGLSGDVDLASVCEVVAAFVERSQAAAPMAWPGGPPSYPRRPVERRLRCAKEQAHVVLAYPGFAADDDRLYTLDVLTTILGGQSGRLFAALRERQGLVYHVSASSVEGIDGGHVAVHAATSQSQLERARTAVDDEVSRVLQEPVSDQELSRAKAWLLGQYEVGMQRRSRVASLLAFDESHGLGAARHRAYPERIARVGAQDVLEVARTVLDPRRRVTSIVSA
jgi:zinc protease